MEFSFMDCMRRFSQFVLIVINVFVMVSLIIVQIPLCASRESVPVHVNSSAIILQ